MGHEVTIRAATAADLAAIAAIQTASPEAAQWDPASYLEQECRVAIVDGRIAGFLAARQTAPAEREILNLAVDPARRRRGIARGLLADELAHSSGAWFLEVRASNLAAIGLYKSQGFQVVARRSGYYHEPAEEAIVMRFHS